MSHKFTEKGRALESFVTGKAIERTVFATAQVNPGRRVDWKHPQSIEALRINTANVLREEGFFMNGAVIIKR